MDIAKFGYCAVMSNIPRKIDSLDATYLYTLKTFYNRNYASPPEAIYMHLSEVIGGLSLLANPQRKPDVDPRKFVPKAIAWWFALCAKHRVTSVERLLWSKFPGICPYCLKCPHEDVACSRKRSIVWEPAWQDLAEVSSATWTKRPRKLGDWQQLFGTIYPTTAIDSYSNAIGRLVEEMGELAESIRTYAIAPGHFLNEAADVFAWIMKIQNISDRDSYGLGGEYGQDLDNAYLNAYLWRCNDCYSSPCKCPAILPTTIGRISLGPSDKDIIGSIFASPQELMAIFSMTDQEPEEVLDQELLSLLTSGVRQLVLLLEASRSLHGSEVEESRAMFKELERLATDSLNFNAATFELAKAIGSQPEQEKSMIEQFLLSVDSSLFATALVTLVGLHFS